MAELQVNLKYDSWTARILLYILLALIPVWGVFSPIAFALIAVFVLFSPSVLSSGPPLIVFGFLAGMIVMTVSAALACIALADNKLLASKDGLRIPCHASLKTAFRRDFSWHEITAVTLGGNLESRDFRLFFKFKSGAGFDINCAKLSQSDLEQFLLALELWCDPVIVDSRLPQVKERLQQQLVLSDSKSGTYTAIWEEELERRFNSTAFVVLEPGSSLQQGKLTVSRQLSFGGLSAVYLCQMNKRELVVLKESVVPADASEDLRRKAEEMFSREARFLMQLKHPNIVTVLDYFVEKGRNYLLLEHINGPDLRQFVKENGPQSERRVLEWARSLCEVLAYLHKQEPPIIHRDLSPDNVVLEQGKTLKVIDFGAANEFIGTATGTLIGKQSYLPMEQLRGKAVPQSDIYALGGTMFFLLSGEDPEPLAVSHPAQIKPELSPQIDALVASCTEMDAAGRPQSAEELLARIDEILQGATAQSSS